MIINADRFIGDWHENLKREIKWYINSIKAGCAPRVKVSCRTYRARRGALSSANGPPLDIDNPNV